ncbi:MAG TPA: phosphopantetheine-binding protein [Arenibaculum sp.]|nr:phosphopantetheine-binding protein [Arenibaculum sp.]
MDTSQRELLSRKEVDQIIRTAVVDVLMLSNVTPESIDGERHNFINDFGANSIDALELIISVEERLQFEFDDDELNFELISSLNHFVDEVCKKMGITA